ncbi:hypothetical protein, partial [Enterococcus sp. HMSC073E08]|uniref:hypothetical protein n=1 Tax=Enterococcus sp. HMSC073E08 TaxID=1739320 RepID=UPI001C405F61
MREIASLRLFCRSCFLIFRHYHNNTGKCLKTAIIPPKNRQIIYKQLFFRVYMLLQTLLELPT